MSISYTCWRCGGLVSATSFAVICVVNKLLTICGAHLGPQNMRLSIVAVVLISIAGAFYEQAPKWIAQLMSQ